MVITVRRVTLTYMDRGPQSKFKTEYPINVFCNENIQWGPVFKPAIVNVTLEHIYHRKKIVFQIGLNYISVLYL